MFMNRFVSIINKNEELHFSLTPVLPDGQVVSYETNKQLLDNHQRTPFLL